MRRPAEPQRERIAARCREIAELLGVATVVEDRDIRLLDDVLAPGYGQLNQATLDAIETGAQTEALILDPIYTGKTMAGFIQRARQAEPGRSLLFVHTGGLPAVFAYGTALTEALDGETAGGATAGG